MEQEQYNDLSNYKDKGILYRILSNESSITESTNNSDETPKLYDICIIYYSLFLKDENNEYSCNPIEKIEIHNPLIIELGKEQVIIGIENVLKIINKNQKVEILISSKYAYGRFGLEEKKIPANADFKCILTLIDFYNKTSINNCLRLKEQGVLYFKDKNYTNAFEVFKECLEISKNLENKLDSSNNSYSTLLDLKLSCLLNSANCMIKERKYIEAITILDKYEKINTKNPKMYYLRFLSNNSLHEKSPTENYYELLLKDYNNINSIDFSNTKYNIDKTSYVEELNNLLKKAEYLILNKDKKSKSSMFSGLYEDKKLKELSLNVPKGILVNNSKVFIEIKDHSNDITFNLEFELFNDICPKTVENFRCLCTGEKQLEEGFEKFTIVGTIFHRFIKGFMMQGGDFENNDGSGGYSIYGKYFEDENFKLNHSEVGLLSMANSGPNTNGSQFFITFGETPWLNGKHVVFGKIIKGLEELKKLEDSVKTNQVDTPLNKIEIICAGEIFKEFI